MAEQTFNFMNEQVKVGTNGQPISTAPITSSNVSNTGTLSNVQTGSFTPVAPTSFEFPKIDVSPTISTSELGGAASSPLDIQKLLRDQQAKQDSLFAQITGAFTPSPEEQAASQQLTSLQNQADQTQLSAQAGIMGAEDRGIAAGTPAVFYQGEQAARARQANLALQTLGIQQQAQARILGNMQSSRQARLEAAKFMYDANRNSLQDSIQLYQMTQPQNLSFQINKATGEGVAIMKNPVTGEIYTKNVGRVTSPDLNTQVVEVGKRKLLIDAQTGNVIKDLGASPSSSSSSSGVDFGNFLSGVGANANNDSIKAAAAQMVSYLPSTQQKAFTGNIERLLKEGKTKEAANSLVTSAINLVGEAATREKLRGKYIAIKQLDQIETLLEQFKQAGGDTNLLNGSLEKISQKVGNTSNQQLAYIWGRIRTSIVDYRRAVSGSAFTEPERKEYAALFPDISKSRKLNEAAVRSLRDSFNTDLEATLETILGTGNYQALQATINGDPLANYINQVNNLSPEAQWVGSFTGPTLPQPKTTTTSSPKPQNFYQSAIAPMISNSWNSIKSFFGGN